MNGAKVVLEHGFEGPYNSGCYDVTLPNGAKFRISGKQASMISLILSGYTIQEGFHPFDAFDRESLAKGRMNAKVVKSGEEVLAAEAESQA